MFDRRTWLKSWPLLGGLAGVQGRATAAAPARDYFKELGVRPFLNAAGTYTMFTASLMPPEVVDAIRYASTQYVGLVDLNRAVGRRIAELLGCEAAMVTAGAASALTLGTAACLTGKNPEFIHRLPDTEGMKTEVIIQKPHRYGYDHAVRNCGVRMVEVETREQLEAAIGPKTAMMLFFNEADPRGAVQAAEFVALGKKHSVPTFNDAAADVPPVENLRKYTRMGFDLVTFSGGKGLRGPQSAGLLLGRRDLIEAALLNAPPNSDSIGRGQKVNKEEMLGMMVALELYLKRDHEADRKEWDRRASRIVDAVAGLPSVTTEVYVPPIANHVPHVRIRWEEGRIKAAVPEVVKALREGEPSIEVVPDHSDGLVVGVWMLQQGEDAVVARRLREVLKAAA